MAIVLKEFAFNGYKVLTLDENITYTCRKYKINGIIYNPVPVSNMKMNVIAVKSDLDFVGSIVEFID